MRYLLIVLALLFAGCGPAGTTSTGGAVEVVIYTNDAPVNPTPEEEGEEPADEEISE